MVCETHAQGRRKLNLSSPPTPLIGLMVVVVTPIIDELLPLKVPPTSVQQAKSAAEQEFYLAIDKVALART